MRHGQSLFNLEERIGGDPGLSDKGVKFAKLLNKFFEVEKQNIGCEKFIINTSALKRTIQTASYLDTESGLFDIHKPIKILNEVNAGICDSLTYEEIEEKYPDIAHDRRQDKMGYRYPKGESYYDVINRAQPYIVELERSKTPTVVISHNAVLRCLYGYFAVLKTDAICDIEIPLHTVIKITPQTYGYHEEIFSFNTETEEITSFKSLEEMIISKGTKNVSFIKRSKQKLSFDDLIDLKRQEDLESPGIDKKIYSTNDIVGMATKSEFDHPISILDALKINTETRTKTKPSKLKRAGKGKFNMGKEY